MVNRQLLFLSAFAMVWLMHANSTHAQYGSCENCYTGPDAGGIPGCQFICFDPNFPSCLQGAERRVCTPGHTFDTTFCTAAGAQNCYYTCNEAGTSYRQGLCLAVPAVASSRTFCDYDAGCGRGASGSILGVPKRIDQSCFGPVYLSNITTLGACGDGGCIIRPMCRPGEPCCPDGTPPPCRQPCTPAPGTAITCPNGQVVYTDNNCHYTCPVDPPPGGACPGTPTCSPSGGRQWACTYCNTSFEVEMPCPTVQRDPWPRGLVGVPNTFSIIDASRPAADDTRTWGCDLVNDAGPNCPQPEWVFNGTYVSGVRAVLTWASEPDYGATWNMDERAGNIGHTSDNIVSPFSGHGSATAADLMGGDLTVRGTRAGATVRHIYETSSVDLVPNGPDGNWPAYQVRLQTRWRLYAAFQWQERTLQTDRECIDRAGQTVPCVCNPGERGCNIVEVRERRSIVDTWHPLPTVQYDVTVDGANVPQDARFRGVCRAEIPVPILQSQTVLQKP
jgi:hypothetical protein